MKAVGVVLVAQAVTMIEKPKNGYKVMVARKIVNLKQTKRKVTLVCDRSFFATLLEDAAKSMTSTTEPYTQEVLSLAKEFTEYEEIHFPDSSQVFLLRDIEKILEK